ncbi:HAD family phosphatase [Streptomyces sp. TG1A-8]|uniref:HAD family hydrolase n=1 Tax=Streptomyces sp. TG1A-8 TaxID=3051385 RepID=UPI00265C0BBB|nr:HAD family phosphatase [Streptomyces sp. TG1A-8]MDO0924212.1 HAD family phosphatase [Streptomyces sp. TG1A-8]
MQLAVGAPYEVDAVVFDMDGVLIDSKPVIENAWRDVARRHGRTLTSADLERYVHGRTGSETVRLLFPHHSDSDRSAIWAEVDTLEEEAPYPVVPGADTLATGLAGKGVPLALATSSWTRKIENALGGLHLLDVFAIQVTRDDVTRGKPHPDPYLAACRRLGVRPQRTLVFEDSVSGVRSAVSAGAVCVGIGGDELTEAGAVAVTPDFTGLGVGAARGRGSLVLTGLNVPVVITSAGERAHA